MAATALVLALAVVSAARMRGARAQAQTSDMGLFTVQASGADAYVYFSENDAQETKIHMLLSIPSCYCIASADVHKVNQIDYFGVKRLAYSFAVYVNDGRFQNRESCNLDTADLQARTELEFNPLGDGRGRRALNLDLFNVTAEEMAALLKPKDPVLERVEGAVLALGIRDYLAHSYLKPRRAAVLRADAPGGFLFTQGTVKMRPCALGAWQAPWIFTGQVGAARTMRFSEPYDAENADSDVYPEADADLLWSIFDDMRRRRVVTDAHLRNLELNNGDMFNVEAFPFQAVFVPFRDAERFEALLAPFATTRLRPEVYVPLVVQMLFAPDAWLHYGAGDNETIALGEGLLHSCRDATIDDAVDSFNVEAARDLFYYAYAYCGGSYIDRQYIIQRAKLYVTFYWERVALFALLALVAVMMLVTVRRRLSAKTATRLRYYLTCGRFGRREYYRLEADDREQGTPLAPTGDSASQDGRSVSL